MSRRFQFSLRALFVAVVFAAMIAMGMRLERQAEVAKIEAQIDELKEFRQMAAEEPRSFPFDVQSEIDLLEKRLKELTGR